jgi:uncharacterized membrane protein YeiB
MKILSIFGLLIISLITGLIIRLIIRNKPKAKLVVWELLIAFWVVFFIYSLVLTFQQEFPLFRDPQITNEISVITSALFLLVGFLNFKKIKKYILMNDVKTKSSDRP